MGLYEAVFIQCFAHFWGISSAVYEAGGHEILVQLLRDSCPRTAANAAATLGNMAEQEVIRCGILLHGAMLALVEPLKSTDTQVLINTTLCLAVLSSDADARAEVGVCVSHDCLVDRPVCCINELSVHTTNTKSVQYLKTDFL